jgi:hypothetical protein
MAQVWDWTPIPEASAREILRQAEVQMSDILAISIAADQRAMTLCSTFGAVAAGLVAADVAICAIQKFDFSVAVSLGIMALGFLTASLTCGFSGRPRQYFAAGYEPAKLILAASDEVWAIRYSAQDLQLRIAVNRDSLRRVAGLTNAGFRIAIGSILLAILVFASLRLGVLNRL